MHAVPERRKAACTGFVHSAPLNVLRMLAAPQMATQRESVLADSKCVTLCVVIYAYPGTADNPQSGCLLKKPGPAADPGSGVLERVAAQSRGEGVTSLRMDPCGRGLRFANATALGQSSRRGSHEDFCVRAMRGRRTADGLSSQRGGIRRLRS